MWNFSCTEPNFAIKYMRSLTHESIKIGRFVFGSTVLFYLTGLVSQKVGFGSYVYLLMYQT